MMARDCTRMSVYVLYAVILAAATQALADAEEHDGDDYEDYDDDEEEDENTVFNTLWPIVMMMIVAGIFIAIIYVFCKKFCPNACCKKHSRSDSSPSEGATASNYPRMPGTLYSETSDIWSTVGSHSTTAPPITCQMEPPPYCDKPPAYEDISSSMVFNKGLINEAFLAENTPDQATREEHEQPSTSQIDNECSPPPYCTAEHQQSTEHSPTAPPEPQPDIHDAPQILPLEHDVTRVPLDQCDVTRILTDERSTTIEPPPQEHCVVHV